MSLAFGLLAYLTLECLSSDLGGGLIVLSEGEGIILKGAENEAGDEMLGAAGGLVKYAHGAIASGV